jgi:DNA-binding transcriptional ArsR family regulator
MIKRENFNKELQDLAMFAKAMSHPARLAILQYLADTKTCISGDISDFLPLSRSTVSQHLSELKKMGLIIGEIEGLKINYCLNQDIINKNKQMLYSFFDKIEPTNIICDCRQQAEDS